MKESIEVGWVVILPEDDNRIYDFTFARTRKESQNHWVSLWDKPNNWKAHYRQGYRCVKAKQVTQIL